MWTEYVTRGAINPTHTETDGEWGEENERRCDRDTDLKYWLKLLLFTENNKNLPHLIIQIQQNQRRSQRDQHQIQIPIKWNLNAPAYRDISENSVLLIWQFVFSLFQHDDVLMRGADP